MSNHVSFTESGGWEAVTFHAAEKHVRPNRENVGASKESERFDAALIFAFAKSSGRSLIPSLATVNSDLLPLEHDNFPLEHRLTYAGSAVLGSRPLARELEKIRSKIHSATVIQRINSNPFLSHFLFLSIIQCTRTATKRIIVRVSVHSRKHIEARRRRKARTFHKYFEMHKFN